MSHFFHKEFSGKSILITGGTKGLGFEAARLFAQLGVKRLFLTYRQDEESAAFAKKKIDGLQASCELIQCDLSEDGAADRLFDEVEKIQDSLDIYIHNAAATAFKNLLELKSHHIDKTMNITVKSFLLGAQRATRLMKNGGAIVTISGMDTLKSVPRHGLLGAAKSALETLTAYYAHELASKNIRVNGINPGFFETESTRKYLGPAFDQVHRAMAQKGPFKRPPTLEEIANTILFLCSSQSTWIVGQTIRVDGGQDFALPLE